VRPLIAVGVLLIGGCLLTNTPRHIPQDRPIVSSAPSVEQKENADTPQLLTPAPPILNLSEAQRQLNRNIHPSISPLKKRGRAIVILHDLGHDENPEAFAVGIDSEKRNYNALQLADYSRLYAENPEAVNFYLLIFKNRQGELYLQRSIDLGEWYVFDFFSKLQLDSNNPLPVIILASFQARHGTEQKLFIFNDTSGRPIYQKILEQTLSVQSMIEDINGDGIVDLIVQENTMEEGTGYETFLTWHRWNGKTFYEYRTTNVVRNLNNFLKVAKKLILEGRHNEFISHCVDPLRAQALKKAGLNDSEIALRSLGIQDPVLLIEINELQTPEILENPFSSRDKKGWFFNPALKIVDQNGSTVVTDATLYMMINPFGKKQFVFFPD